MKIESQIQSVARYFFFSLLDEASAQKLTIKTMRVLKKDAALDESTSRAQQVIVETVDRLWRKKKEKTPRNSAISSSSGWVLPQGVDVGYWKQFALDAEDDNLSALIWSKIVNFEDANIARGLGISEGSLRYRVAQALSSVVVVMSEGAEHD